MRAALRNRALLAGASSGAAPLAALFLAVALIVGLTDEQAGISPVAIVAVTAVGTLIGGMLGALVAVTNRAGSAIAARRLVRAALVAGLAGGVFLGVGARLMMRVMALLGGSSGDFSLSGTFGIMLLAVVFVGFPTGLLFTAVQRWLPGRGALKGLPFGLVVFGLLAVLNPAAGEVDAFANLLWIVLLGFGAVTVGYAVVMAATISALTSHGAAPAPLRAVQAS
jgi:hypothetical protein